MAATGRRDSDANPRENLCDSKTLQWQAQPPPQQPPPPEAPPFENELGVEEPPLGVAKTESWIVAFLLAHFGQEISCCLLKTTFSNGVLQSSQMYS